MNKQEATIQIHPSIVKLKEKIEALKDLREKLKYYRQLLIEKKVFLIKRLKKSLMRNLKNGRKKWNRYITV